MPSTWITSGKILESSFSSNSGVSTDIAALKLYMYLCMFSSPVTRKKTDEIDFLSHPSQHKQYEREITLAEACLTYDQLTEGCGLSRLLVSRGLKKLKASSLISKEGTIRKITYVIQGGLDSGWCKLPKRPLVKLEHKVSSFCALKNRYKHERDALKIFMYLLTVRKNSYEYVDVSRGKISKTTGVDLHDIDKSIAFLTGIGLLDEIVSKGYIKGCSDFLDKNKLHRYFVVNSGALNLPKRPTIEGPIEIPS